MRNVGIFRLDIAAIAVVACAGAFMAGSKAADIYLQPRLAKTVADTLVNRWYSIGSTVTPVVTTPTLPPEVNTLGKSDQLPLYNPVKTISTKKIQPLAAESNPKPASTPWPWIRDFNADIG